MNIYTEREGGEHSKTTTEVISIYLNAKGKIQNSIFLDLSRKITGNSL